MATPGRTRVGLGAPLPAIPEKKKRGPKPGSKYKKKGMAELDCRPKKIECVEKPDAPHDGLIEKFEAPARLNRVVEVLTAEYGRLREARDAAQAKMDYLDGLYHQMTDGAGHL